MPERRNTAAVTTGHKPHQIPLNKKHCPIGNGVAPCPCCFSLIVSRISHRGGGNHLGDGSKGKQGKLPVLKGPFWRQIRCNSWGATSTSARVLFPAPTTVRMKSPTRPPNDCSVELNQKEAPRVRDLRGVLLIWWFSFWSTPNGPSKTPPFAVAWLLIPCDSPVSRLIAKGWQERVPFLALAG